jgi:hypothetical protein
VSFLLLIVGGYLVFDGQLNAQITVVLYVTSVTIACVASLFMLVRPARRMACAMPLPSTARATGGQRLRPWLFERRGDREHADRRGADRLLSGPDAAGLYSVAQRGALLVAFRCGGGGHGDCAHGGAVVGSHDRVQLQRLVTLGARGAFVASLPIGLGFILSASRS